MTYNKSDKMVNLTDVRALRSLLKHYDIVPKKHWGQNFLVSKKVLSEMMDASKIEKDDVVLEIGGGVGTLSYELARVAKKLIVVERDPKLCEVLKNSLSEFDNVEILCEDARKLDLSKIPSPYRVVANLPYSVGLPILMNILESTNPPENLYVMLQKEVVERIVAKPPNGTLVGAAMQYLSVVEKLFIIPANTTWPAPEVDSAYLKITPRPDIASWDRSRFMKTLRLGFAHPRKKVISNLSSDEIQKGALMGVCRIDENARAQQLTVEEWRCIAAHLPAR